MRVNRLEYSGWRNLSDGEIEPCDGVNIIYGSNAQGKTNLLEAIWLFTGAKSFRGAKEAELIALGRDTARISMEFHAQGRQQEGEIRLGSPKKALLNGVEQSSVAQMAGVFCAVVFAPVHLSLIKDGPALRRRFLDSALGQLKPGYLNLLAEYHRAVQQRNALLRDVQFHSELAPMLDIWEDTIAKSGSKIAQQRCRYIEELLPEVCEFYDGLSSGKEKLDLQYDGEQYRADNGGLERLRADLSAARGEDTRLGVTTVGPHRDDLLLHINCLPARNFASQGQQRCAALALKLAEAAVLTRFTGEQPVALLDDVMSELDPARQDYILNRIQGWQVFITCCEPSSVLRMANGSAFEMVEGTVTQHAQISTVNSPCVEK